MSPARHPPDSCFRATALERHYKLMHPSQTQRSQHIDFVMSGLDKSKIVTTVTLDIKYRGKKKSDAWQWLEFRNPAGKTGWLYQASDFIVFERRKDFILVNRKSLVEWVNLFKRPKKNESITQIKTSDLLQIAGTHIWSKKQ